MSTLALLVLLLLVLVGFLVVGVPAYLVHRHPSLVAPVGVAIAAAALLAACVVPIVVR